MSPAGVVVVFCFREVEGAFVFGADGVVEQAPVAEAHLRGLVAEECHECLQGDTGVDQRAVA